MGFDVKPKFVTFDMNGTLIRFRINDALREVLGDRLPAEIADDYLQACKVYRIDVPYSAAQLTQAICDTIERNGLSSCYVRPMVLRGYGAPGMYPVGSPVETYICCFPWGTYLGEGALEAGVEPSAGRLEKLEAELHRVARFAAMDAVRLQPGWLG